MTPRLSAGLAWGASAALALATLVLLARNILAIPAHVPLDPNEGWNAAHALAAMAGHGLYPPPQALMVNNYPPLSFYLIGAVAGAGHDVLAAGRLRFRSGRVTLSMFSGVVLTVEGPADLELVAIDRVFCRRGRLRTRVPEGAEGFVVASSGSAVIDMGTEFALNVETDGKSQVMVFEGLAEAALLE